MIALGIEPQTGWIPVFQPVFQPGDFTAHSCYGAHKGVSNVELAASLVAEISGVDDARTSGSYASRPGIATVPIFKSPRSSLSLESLRSWRKAESPGGTLLAGVECGMHDPSSAFRDCDRLAQALSA